MVHEQAEVTFDETGKPIEMFGTVQDITERKHAEDMIRKNNDLLTAISRTESQFIAGIDPRTFFDGLLNDLVTLTKSEYGFIGEVIYPENGDPYIKTYAITNIAWNDEMRAFFDREAPKGLEFRKLKSLWGAVITTGKPVISNSPSTDPRRGGFRKDIHRLMLFGIAALQRREINRNGRRR